jgi:hypothetical protein
LAGSLARRVIQVGRNQTGRYVGKIQPKQGDPDAPAYIWIPPDVVAIEWNALPRERLGMACRASRKAPCPSCWHVHQTDGRAWEKLRQRPSVPPFLSSSGNWKGVMNMTGLTPTEIAAYIGAAAWAPQILTWIYRHGVKPVAEIVPEPRLQLGFTTYGPIFNIRLALCAAKKDAIIDRIEIDLRHQEGELHALTWTGMRETFSEIVDETGNRQLVEKDQPAIALKVTTALLIEKFVRFQDLAFHDRLRLATSAFDEHLGYLKRQDGDYPDVAIKSREFLEVKDLYRQHFWWRPGVYTFSFRIKSRHGANLNAGAFEFTLTQQDTDALQRNLDLIGVCLEDALRSDLPGFQPRPLPWAWRDVPLTDS